MSDSIRPALIALPLHGQGALEALERIWDAGDAALPLPPDLPEPELRQLLAELRPHRLRDRNGRDLPLPDPAPLIQDTALVVTTSGSTGRPKAAVLSHAALETATRASLDRLGSSTTDRWLCCLPLHHIGGLQVLLRARALGTDPIVHDRFDVAAVAEATQATHVSLVPTMLARLLDARVDLSRLSAILVGGGPAPAGLLERAAAAGARLVAVYGMTETCGGCVYDGVPLDGIEVTIGDDQRIRIRGPVLMEGYRCRDDLTHTVLRHGWLETADVGRWDERGRLEVLGRADDVLVTGGEKVAANEVADLLRLHPGVADVAVVGAPDPEWGQRVVAVVVPATADHAPTLEELRAHVQSRAAAYKAPRELRLVTALPRTPLGKLDRTALGRSQPSPPASLDDRPQ